MQISIDIEFDGVVYVLTVDESSHSNGSTNGRSVDEVTSLSFVNVECIGFLGEG